MAKYLDLSGLTSVWGKVASKFVRYDTAQSLTDAQKEQARENIKATSNRPNLFDNSWFLVNSRQVTSVTTNGYGLDRWYMYGANGTMSVSGHTITMSSGALLLQRMASDLKAKLNGQPITVSAMYSNGTIVSGSVTYNSAPSSNTNIFSDTVAAWMLTDGNFRFAASASATIQAVKLELGSFSTLVNDVMPDYGEELTRCIYSTADPNDTYANNGFGRSNENLIDNPWFNVNQREVSNTTVSAGLYYFDRWMAETTGAVWSGTATGASINNSGQSGFSAISQRILLDDYNAGDVYTLSIKFTTNGRIYYGTGALPTRTSSDQAAITVFTDYGELRLWVLNTGVTAYNLAVQMRVSAGLNVKIRAIKLEKGAVCTLANDTMPNYQQDLAKCQRYCIVITDLQPFANGYFIGSGTQAFLMVPTPVTMRAKPSVTITGSLYLRWLKANGTVGSVSTSSLGVSMVASNGVVVIATASGDATLPTTSYLSGTVVLSADL